MKGKNVRALLLLAVGVLFLSSMIFAAVYLKSVADDKKAAGETCRNHCRQDRRGTKHRC